MRILVALMLLAFPVLAAQPVINPDFTVVDHALPDDETARFTLGPWYVLDGNAANSVTQEAGAGQFDKAIQVKVKEGVTPFTNRYLFQVMTTATSLHYVGKSFDITFTAWKSAGSTLSSFHAYMMAGEGNDQASWQVGTWTGQHNVADQVLALTTIPTRYTLSITVPMQSAYTGEPIRQLALGFLMANAGPGASDDWVRITGVRFTEAGSSEIALVDHELESLRAKSRYHLINRVGAPNLIATGQIAGPHMDVDGDIIGWQADIYLYFFPAMRREDYTIEISDVTHLHMTAVGGKIDPVAIRTQTGHKGPRSTLLEVDFGTNPGANVGIPIVLAINYPGRIALVSEL